MNNEGKQSFWDEIKSWFENEFGGNTQDIDARLGRIEKHIRSIDRKVTHVSVNVDELNKDLNRLADGYVALKNENDALKQALNDADAAQAQAVADALAVPTPTRRPRSTRPTRSWRTFPRSRWQPLRLTVATVPLLSTAAATPLQPVEVPAVPVTVPETLLPLNPSGR